ncbi:hypothetical protein SteCoe_14546 [Stentor coeruleus]|uniref:Uncharacterized protein n=1 Tax=Stentor coeruleus TaxID=5963 RepID=A0A1R2C5U3_9CILI|nr:hypothetical protein SteCoe_14546 [Stentor coeruleus]
MNNHGYGSRRPLIRNTGDMKTKSKNPIIPRSSSCRRSKAATAHQDMHSKLDTPDHGGGKPNKPDNEKISTDHKTYSTYIRKELIESPSLRKDHERKDISTIINQAHAINGSFISSRSKHGTYNEYQPQGLSSVINLSTSTRSKSQKKYTGVDLKPGIFSGKQSVLKPVSVNVHSQVMASGNWKEEARSPTPNTFHSIVHTMHSKVHSPEPMTSPTIIVVKSSEESQEKLLPWQRLMRELRYGN